MSKKTRSINDVKPSPGPGNYDAKVPERYESQVYSIGARRADKNPINRVVGPGSYNQGAEATQNKSPTWRFGSE